MRGPRVLADVLEGSQAVRAERLEVGELRLHSHDVRRDGVDQSPAEALHRVGCGGTAPVDVTAELDRQKLGIRVEADE